MCVRIVIVFICGHIQATNILLGLCHRPHLAPLCYHDWRVRTGQPYVGATCPTCYGIQMDELSARIDMHEELILEARRAAEVASRPGQFMFEIQRSQRTIDEDSRRWATVERQQVIAIAEAKQLAKSTKDRICQGRFAETVGLW